MPPENFKIEKENFSSVVKYLERLNKEHQTEIYSNLIPLDIHVFSTTGEKHGSWFLSFEWTYGNLFRIAEMSFTNPGSLADEDTLKMLVTVRAGATNDLKFVFEDVEKRRVATNLKQLEPLLAFISQAVIRASAFTESSLTTAYEFVASQSSENLK